MSTETEKTPFELGYRRAPSALSIRLPAPTLRLSNPGRDPEFTSIRSERSRRKKEKSHSAPQDDGKISRP
jgi:hypothetical protein